MTKCVRAKIKNGVAYKPLIKIIGILLTIVSFVESSDQAIAQIIKKSILMFSVNPNNCFTRTYLKQSQPLLVCCLQPSTNVTRNFILERVLYNVF